MLEDHADAAAQFRQLAAAILADLSSIQPQFAPVGTL
jgi:hypothetical protein